MCAPADGQMPPLEQRGGQGEFGLAISRFVSSSLNLHRVQRLSLTSYLSLLTP